MAKNISFEEFRGSLTNEELNTLVKLSKKKRSSYLIGHICCLVLGLAFILLASYRPIFGVYSILIEIPFIIAMGIFAGLGCWTHNWICFITSRGKRGGGFTSFIWALFGGLIVALIVIGICCKKVPYKTVLGWGKSNIFDDNDRL